MAYEIERVLTDKVINELDTETADKLDRAIEQDENDRTITERRIKCMLEAEKEGLQAIKYLIESCREIKTMCDEMANMMRDTYEIVQDI